MLANGLIKLLPCLFLFSASLVGAAAPGSPATPAPAKDFETWLTKQYDFSLSKVMAAIQPKPNAAPGTVMASPTIVKPNPDYYYHWVRDASVTMDTLVMLLEKTRDAPTRAKYTKVLTDYNNLTQKLQSLKVPAELKKMKGFEASQFMGEPKYMMDGTPFLGEWGRPQNDGPATRAMATSRFISYLAHVKNPLYTKMYGTATHPSPLQRDLEYTYKNWKLPSFEIWEEVKGLHFYTYMVQRRAMLDGAKVAERFGDIKSATKYKQEAAKIEKEIVGFWDEKLGHLIVTKGRVAGVDYKKSQLDTQTLLGSLHASIEGDNFFNPEDDRIHATFMALKKAFGALYTINKQSPRLAPTIGRYPEDMYNGYNADIGGNPWMLLTAAMAEVCYRTRNAWTKKGSFKVTKRNAGFITYVSGGKTAFKAGETIAKKDARFQATLKGLTTTGDRYLQRVRLHTEKDGMHLAEQWNRETGKQQGAEDLTWSYVSFITAFNARKNH